MDVVSSHRVVVVVYPDFQVLDLTGPHEVFAQATRYAPDGSGYQLEIAAAGASSAGSAGSVRSRNGLTVGPVGDLDACTGAIDTLLVVGGPGRVAACADDRLIEAVALAARRSRRVASVCSGAFLLATAGLLDGRRAVTHWASCAELAEAHPAVTVDPDPVFVRDGEVWTSAGVTAGMDLALAMVEADLGAEVSREVARRLVMFVQRPGHQAQFSAQLAAQRPTREPLRDVQAWVADHLGGDLTVSALADRAGMSERNFARVFAAETGRTPAAYVEAARIEAAQRLLESTDSTIDAVARTCGFGTTETLHRAFRRSWTSRPGSIATISPRPGPRSPVGTKSERSSMRIAIPLFDGFTALDAVGPYEVLRFLPGAEVVFTAAATGPVRNNAGHLAVTADATFADVDTCDMLLVPGGPGARVLLDDDEFLGWIRRMHAAATWTTSVCTGALLLGAAGILTGLTATTHWRAVDTLESFGATYLARRVVFEGQVVTAAGVSAGIDMALALAARIAGDTTAQAIQLTIEYDPQPPFDAGSLATAPRAARELADAGFVAAPVVETVPRE